MKTKMKTLVCNFLSIAWLYTKKLMIGLGVILIITLVSAASVMWNNPIGVPTIQPEKYTIEIYNDVKVYSYTCDDYELKDNVIILKDSIGFKTRELIISDNFLTDIHLTEE